MNRWILGFLYGATALLSWTVPPLATLHYPAALPLAVVAFFGSGWVSVQYFQSHPQASLSRALWSHLPLLSIPLIGLLLPGLWRTHCDLLAGFGYFLLYPVSSALFATAVAYWLTSRSSRYAGWKLTGLGVFIVLAGPLYDLGLHPQFYTYNHVFGGVLAPIYDRFLPFRPGLVAFRGVTLLWIGLLWARGHAVRYGWGVWSGPVGAATAFALAAAYLFAGELHINTTSQTLQRELDQTHTTAHFDLHYAHDDLDSLEAVRIGDELEFERARLIHDLNAGSEAPTGIHVYLYPDAETRARLTGAHATSIAPVWLNPPQTHLLSRNTASLPHELAHLMTRPYGLPVINASWLVGLVEGWAVALEAPTRQPSPNDQVLAMTPPGDLPNRADALQQQWSPWGFWSQRAGVSYTVFGSFVGSVAAEHGHPAIAEAYAWGTLEQATSCSMETLTTRWIEHLSTTRVMHAEARPVAQRRFRIPSFFELPCPYEPPPAQAQYRTAQIALAEGDTTAARTALHEALSERPDFPQAQRQLAALHLTQHAPEAAHKALGDSTTWTASDWGLAGRAALQQSDFPKAELRFKAAWASTPRSDVEARARWIARATDASNGSPPDASPSTWSRMLQDVEHALNASDTDFDDAYTTLLDRLEAASLPRGWRNTLHLRLLLSRVEAANQQRDWIALHQHACAAHDYAARLQARPLIKPLQYTAKEAYWHQHSEIASSPCATSDAS